jgi:AraC-like DNA-binding protein
MDDYFKIEYPFYYDDDEVHPGVLVHYRRSPDEPIDVDFLSHERPFVGMIINLSGHMLTYWIDGEGNSLAKGHYNFFFLPPGSSRWLLKPKLNSILCFECLPDFLQQFVGDAPALRNFLTSISFNRAVTLTPNSLTLPSTIMDGIVDITKENQFVGLPRQAYLRVKAGSALLAGIINSQKRNRESKEALDNAELHSIYRYMVDNLEHIRDTRPLLSLSKMREEEIKEKFKHLYGKTLSEALHEERLKKGEHLLIYTYTPILEIGTLIGYTSRNAFSTAFHQRYGMYPKDFRNKFNKLPQHPSGNS